MRPILILFVLFSILLSAGSQIVLKHGMTSPAMAEALVSKDWPTRVGYAIVSLPSILLGLILFGLSAISWLFVLSKLPLSTAYPFVALGIAITVVAGRFLFNEPISLMKLIGVTFIIIGVTFVGTSSQ